MVSGGLVLESPLFAARDEVVGAEGGAVVGGDDEALFVDV